MARNWTKRMHELIAELENEGSADDALYEAMDVAAYHRDEYRIERNEHATMNDRKGKARSAQGSAQIQRTGVVRRPR